MLNRYLTYFDPVRQIVVLCALLGMTFLLGAFFINFLNTTFVGYDSQTLQTMKEIPAHLINRIKLVEVIAAIAVFLVPGILFAYLAFPDPLQYLGLKSLSKKRHVLMGILLLVIALPFSTLLEQWNAKIPMFKEMIKMNEQYETMATAMLSGTQLSDLFINILAICVLPAMIEEILFRGCIQQIFVNLLKDKPWIGLIITAAIFSLMHFELSGFFPRFFLGFMLGLGYYLSGSLWVSIAMHITNNLIIVLLAYLSHTHVVSLDLNHLPEMNTWIGLLSLVITIALVYVFLKDRTAFPIYVMKDEELQQNID